MALGNIVDANPDHSATDDWALVLGGTVQNTIVANYAFIQSIQSSYDYLVDYTYGGQDNVETGSSYDSTSDTFTLPPPDYDQELTDALTQLAGDLANVMSIRGAITTDPSADISAADTSSLSAYDALTDLWPDIATYVEDNSS